MSARNLNDLQDEGGYADDRLRLIVKLEVEVVSEAVGTWHTAILRRALKGDLLSLRPQQVPCVLLAVILESGKREARKVGNKI